MTDFDKLIDRRSTLSCKWNVGENELPMWIADMDFEAPDAIKRALHGVVDSGVYGYTYIPDEFFRSISDFYARRHGAPINTEHMIYSNGAVAAVSSMVRRLSSEGDNVLLQAPVYNIFFNSIVNNHRKVLSSDLIYADGKFEVDFADLEEKLSRPETTLMIVCNPHNPVGKIWSKDELSRIAELCHKHGVSIISDEVHAEFVKSGCHYTPFYTVSELAASISATIISPSKTFNAAGFQTATLVVPNDELRYKIWRGLNDDEIGEPNVFAMKACIAAFNECEWWVDNVVSYIFDNRRAACEYIKENIPALSVPDAESTYLLWVDISGVSDDSVEFCRRLRELTGLYISNGKAYGECANLFVRINLATQRSRVMDGMERLRRGVEAILAERA